MTAITIPSAWGEPDFHLNQLVLFRACLGQWHKGRIVGLEYIDADHSSFTGEQAGWKYIILADSSDRISHVEPICWADNSQVIALNPALAKAVG